MAKYTLDMVLEYAKVFPENADMGNPDGPAWQKAIADKGGQYVVNAFFTDEEQIDRLMSDGFKLGNGTRAKVQFETYADGNGVRLNGIAVTELVERTSEPTEDDQIFMVA